jgi:hypothetical protein
MDDEDMQALKEKLGSIEIPVLDSAGRRQMYSLATYEWLRACQAAATGDYDEAAKNLAKIREMLRTKEETSFLRLRRGIAIAVTSELGLMSRPETLTAQILMRNNQDVLVQAYPSIQFLRAQQADLHVVAGVLALEQGLPAEAERHFKNALELCPSDGEPIVNFAGRPLAEAQTPRFRPARK